MRKRSFGSQKLHGAETNRREGESGVEPDDRRGFEQRGERPAAPGLLLEHAVDVAQRFLAAGAVALVISVARLIHRFGDRLRLLAGEIACLLFGAGDRSRSRLAMHSGERRLRRRPPLSRGGVQKLGDVEVGLIDPIGAWPSMSWRGAEDERHSCNCRLSNDHFLPPLDSGGALARRPEAVAVAFPTPSTPSRFNQTIQ
jgi:hypothetical protein